MSSDGKEPGPIRQSYASSGWEHSVDLAQSIDQGTSLFHMQEQKQHFSTPPPQEDEGDDQAPAKSASLPTEMLKQIVQYLVLMLIPLMFAGLTAWFVLPPVAANRAQIRAEGLWLVVAILIMIALAQMIAVFFAGNNSSLWALATAGGLCLFGLIPGLLLLLLIFAAIIALTRYYFHPVPEGYIDVIHAFSKYSRTLYPGFNILLPWEKVYQQLNVAETQWTSPPQLVQLSMTQDVTLRGTISYQLSPEDAHLAISQGRKWEERLRENFVQCIQSIATTFVPNDFIPWQDGLQPVTSQRNDSNVRWEQINQYLFQEIRDKVAMWGVLIHWVGIHDVLLVPHGVSLMATNTPVSDPSTSEDTTIVSAGNQPIIQEQPHQVAEVKPSEPAQPIIVTTQALGEPPKVFKADVLSKAYREVQHGRITDPEIIRSIAANFEAIARDPRANDAVDFDAAQAARNLIEQAQKYEQEYAAQQGKLKLDR